MTVPYDRELIAQMLDVCGHPMYTLDAYREQARLLREADNADAAKVGTAIANAQQPAAVECDCPSGRVDHASWCAVSKAQDAAACVGCEGKPAPENTPCAVCGRQTAVEIERLVEALRWYVENDDTNEGQEGNEYWLAGRDRAIAVLREHDKGA